jgi:hypothetical protein
MPTTGAVLVWDGAGAHTAADVVVPDGIDLVPVPPSSPERQPAERLWPLIDEVIANRGFADVDALEAVLVPRCQTLREHQDTIRARTCSHRRPSDIAPVIRT